MTVILVWFACFATYIVLGAIFWAWFDDEVVKLYKAKEFKA